LFSFSSFSWNRSAGLLSWLLFSIEIFFCENQNFEKNFFFSKNFQFILWLLSFIDQEYSLTRINLRDLKGGCFVFSIFQIIEKNNESLIISYYYLLVLAFQNVSQYSNVLGFTHTHTPTKQKSFLTNLLSS